jgi:hypothetical protein
MRCPPIRYRRPGSGCPAVRCPVTWGRRPEGPAVGRLLSTPSSVQPSAVPPSGVQPSGVCLVRPDTSVSSHLRRWGPGRGGQVTVTTGTGGGPCGCWAVDGSIDGRGGRDAGDAAEVAMVNGRSVADPGRRVGVRAAAAALWARKQAAARGGCTRRVAAVLGLGARPRCVVVAEPYARVGGPEGTTGRVGRDGRAAPARPQPAASAPDSAPAAL